MGVDLTGGGAGSGLTRPALPGQEAPSGPTAKACAVPASCFLLQGVHRVCSCGPWNLGEKGLSELEEPPPACLVLAGDTLGDALWLRGEVTVSQPGAPLHHLCD